MIMVLIKTSLTFCWLKSKIYLKKVAVMANNTLTRTTSFVYINLLHYQILIFIIYTRIPLRKVLVRISCLHELNLIFVNFAS